MFKVFEYAGFLGDPFSAIFGAFSELAEDWWLTYRATLNILRQKDVLKRELLATAILAGQTEINEKTEEELY